MTVQPADRNERAGRSAGRTPADLDDVHRRMLEVLRADGRISVAALAEQVGVSRANAYARLEWLRAEGVVEGFSALVDSRRLGLGVAALVLLSVRPAGRQALGPALEAMPQVEYAALVSGDQDAVVLVRVADVDGLRDDVLGPLQALPHVEAARAVLILDEMVQRPFVL